MMEINVNGSERRNTIGDIHNYFQTHEYMSLLRSDFQSLMVNFSGSVGVSQDAKYASGDEKSRTGLFIKSHTYEGRFNLLIESFNVKKLNLSNFLTF